MIQNSDLWKVKRVVAALELSLLELLELKCVFCVNDLEQWRDLAGLPRNEITRSRREELALSQEDLLAKIGWTERFAKYSGPDYPNSEWVVSTMRRHRTMEDRPDSIEEFTLDEVMQVAAGVEIPAELLLGVRYPQCDVKGPTVSE